MAVVYWADQGRAAAYLGRITLALVKAAGARRQRHMGRHPGARAPASLAAGSVSLVQLTRAAPGGKVDLVTPVGHRTAVRDLPPLLARLEANDRRRVAASLVATAFERIGAVAGSNFEGGDTSGEISDGGATTRIKHAARLRQIEGVARWDPAAPGRARVLLAAQRGGRNRQDLLAYPCLIAVCVYGATLGDLLARSGWSVHTRNRAELQAALLQLLAELADALAL